MTGDPPMMPDVRAVFDACPAPARAGLMVLCRMILARANDLPVIGRVVEGLRWGQPAYLTPDIGAGCSLRIGPVPGAGFGLFVHCQTGLIDVPGRAGGGLAAAGQPGGGVRGGGSGARGGRCADRVGADLSCET